MKSFRVKDLMINVSPCAACTLSCNAHPTCVGKSGCGITCKACTLACTVTCNFPTCAGNSIVACPCSHFASCGCTYICSIVGCTTCTILISACTVITRQDDPQTSLDALTALKQQLQQQLADLETQEQAMNAALKPQTVSQVDQLMQKLQEAMDDLNTRRAELAKKEAQGK